MREKVLKKIRSAQVKSNFRMDLKEPDMKRFVFKRPEENLIETFAKEFSKNHGKFIYCQNNTDMVGQMRTLINESKWKHVFCTEEKLRYLLNDTSIRYKYDLKDFADAQVSITGCLCLVARTGSVLLSTAADKSRKLSVYPPIHIVVAYYDQIYFDLEDALKYFRTQSEDGYPSMLSIISGPSRTADIEKTLVLGAHGPKNLYCFFVNER